MLLRLLTYEKEFLFFFHFKSTVFKNNMKYPIIWIKFLNNQNTYYIVNK